VTKMNYRHRWVLVLALGLFAIALGFFITVYAIIVVERGPFPATSSSYLISAWFLVGMGMGYVVCSFVIRDLEKKLDLQNAKEAH